MRELLDSVLDRTGLSSTGLVDRRVGAYAIAVPRVVPDDSLQASVCLGLGVPGSEKRLTQQQQPVYSLAAW
eukprot:1566111-Rhodomonas_salina.1